MNPHRISLVLALCALVSLPTQICAQKQQSSKDIVVAPVNQLPSREKRWALIIGIDEYEKDISSLKGAVNDAKSLKDVLVKYAGFPENQIIVLTSDAVEPDNQPKRENILGALSDLSLRVPKDGLLLFSFSGHGVSVGNQAFLVPSNGRITQNLSLLKSLSINVVDIKEAIQEIKVKQVLMLLDACRNEPGRGDMPNVLTSAYVNAFSFDVANSDVKAFATLYATEIGERAFEFYDRVTRQYRGYFSFAIEEALKGKAANDKGEVTLRQLIDYLETTVPLKVKFEKGAVQVPSASLSETYKANELILSLAQAKSIDPIKPVANVKSGELAYWQAIETSNEISDFEDYLTRTERGEFAGSYKATAELKLFRLKKANAPVAWAKFKASLEKLNRYADLQWSTAGLFIITQNKKYGALDPITWDEVIPPKYDNIIYDSSTKGFAKVQLNDKWGIFDTTGRKAIPIEYDDVSPFYEELAGVKLNSKWGFVDKAARAVIPISYDWVGAFVDGLAAVKLNNKYGFVDKTGKEVIPTKYDFVNTFVGGVAPVGLIDGRETSDGGITYRYTYKKGFVNKRGNEIVPMKYDDVGDFQDGIAKVELKGKWGLIDKTGREITPIKYANIGDISEGFVRVRLNDKDGFVDLSGRELVPPKYDLNGSISSGWQSFKEGFAIVELNHKVGFIDNTGKEVIPVKYDHLHPFENGWALAGLAGKFGFLDQTGKEAIPIRYEGEFAFYEGLAAVKLNGKYGFIDKTGKAVIPFIYDLAWRLPNGMTQVKLNNKWGIIDHSGKEIVPAKYDDLRTTFIKEGFIGVTVDGKDGFIDLYGNEYFDLALRY